MVPPLLIDLSKSPFAEVLRQLSTERRSGDLEVRSGKLVKTVFFDHGRVVFAASNLRKDRLGEALVAIGRITDADFQKASALMKEGARKQRFGEALVQAGVLEGDELGRMVARQVKRTVLSLFQVADGVASFEERECTVPLEYMVSLSVHRLLYVGIKSMASETLVMEGLGALDRWVRLATIPPFRFGIKKCSAEEKEVMELAQRKATLRRLAWAPGGLSFPRLRIAYSLFASGILEDAEQPEAPQPIIQMDTSTFLLSALQRKPDPSAREIIRKEVDEELSRSANLDREQWLRVSQSAPHDQLVRALEDKMERYHALVEAVGDDQALRTDVELILGRALSMLRLARQAQREGTSANVVSTPQTEGAESLPAAAKRPAKPRPAPPVPESPASEPAAPEAPAASEPPDAGAPSAPIAHAFVEAHPDGAMVGSARIEHLLIEGSVRMTVRDYANAVKVYAELVDLQPKVAGYHQRLAVAMAYYPATQKQAEREFVEAVRLDPDNADLHYQFAAYYRAMKVRSRAVAELRTVVRLNPRHKQAREDLEALSPKDSALSSLKKLFK
jgi:tetratricopeptide (TPR) repeat protein